MKQFLKDHFPLLIAIFIFIGFGIYHLAQFETTDEHFWKYDRINKYYSGIEKGFTENDWSRTRINDKPGVTVALISGIGKLYGPDPESHIDHEGENANSFYDEKSGKTKLLYDMYHTELTEEINFAMRLPILLFNALIILPLLYYLTWQLTRNKMITHVSMLFIGMSPILIGISQIINPDAMLWGIASVALFAFITYLYNEQKKFLILASVFTGLALLSKYTANLLFLFYPALFILHTVYNNKEFSWKRDGWKYTKDFFIICAIAWTIFIILMPEVIQVPRHFLYGTIYSPTLAPITDIFLNITNLKEFFYISPTKYKTIPIGITSLLIFFATTVVLPILLTLFFHQRKKIIQYMLNTGIIFIVILFLFSFLNAWTSASFFSLDDIKEDSRSSGELIFPDFASNPETIFYLKALTVQMQNFVFSLPPLLIALIFFLWWTLLANKMSRKEFLPIAYFFSLMPFVFILGGLLADIFVNVRYSIMLYTPYALLGGYGAYEIAKNQKIAKKIPQKIFYFCVLTIIIVTQLLSLWLIKPFYFNYTNLLLPRKYVVTDSWGYGVYEAATYLNALPDAEKRVIWTDRRGICQYFTGKCIVSNELYLDHTPIDYFVFSRRGMITKPFRPRGDNPHDITVKRYHDENFLAEHTVFELHIGNRPENFIRVVKIEK